MNWRPFFEFRNLRKLFGIGGNLEFDRELQLSAIALCKDGRLLESRPVLADLNRSSDKEVTKRAGLALDDLSHIIAFGGERNKFYRG